MSSAGKTNRRSAGVLSAWHKSGLSLEKFAKERGLVPQRIRAWRNKLEGKPATTPAAAGSVALLPVEVPPQKRGEPVAVYLRNGHVVRVGRGFDEDAFTRVVAILEGA